MNRFVVLERDLLYTVNKYKSLGKIPIIDYAVEHSKYDTIFNKHKIVNIIESYPNNYHALKLSSVNFCGSSIIDIVNAAIYNNCKLLIDAEENETLNKVDEIADILMKRNLGTTFKTYQMYRKDSMSKLREDLVQFNQYGITHQIKLVRGAYMHIDKPHIFNTKQDVDKIYNEALNILKYKCRKNDNLQVIFATHNKTSYDMIKDETKKNVFHATLMGMDDAYTGNIQSMVYIPFGPITKTYPYLLRRLYENNFLMTYKN